MAFKGWFQFAGTEIVNVERTTQYVRKNLTGLPFTNRYPSDALPAALALADGDPTGLDVTPVYESPALDRPDWFDPDDPNSHDFYGFYPLTVEGLQDGTEEVTITELAGPGAVHSRSRAAHREIRFTGLLIGTHWGAVDAGMVWLRKALQGSACDGGTGCAGDVLCFFFQEPDLCCDPVPEADLYNDPVTYGDVPDTVWTTLLGLGWAGRPSDTEERLYPPADWPYAGAAACLARTQRQLHDVTLLSPPKVLEEYATNVGAVRRVEFLLSADDPHIWGLPVQVPDPGVVPVDVVGGTAAAPLVLAADRTNLSINPSLDVNVTGWSVLADLGTPDLTRVTATTGAFGRARFLNVPTGAHGYVLSDDVPVTPGTQVTASIDVRAPGVGQVRAGLRWFSGGETPISDTLGPLVDVAPGWNRLTVNGFAPAGTVEVDALVVVPVVPLTRVNLANNPSAEVRSWNAATWGTSPATGVLTRVTTGGPRGGAFTRMTWTVGSGSGGGIGGSGTDNINIPVAAGQAFGGSVMVRTSAATWLQMEMGATRGTPTQCAPGVWTMLTVSGVSPTATTLAPKVIPAALAPTPPWKQGDTLDVDDLLVETGTSIDPFGTYFDGTFTGATWTGTAGTSTSTWAPVVDVDRLILERGTGGDYFDGNTPDDPFYRYGWTGTVGASTSVRQPIAPVDVDCTTPGVQQLVDPSLPALPAPPRPPVIVPAGITPVTSWDRRVYPIPADLIPTWSDSVPVVTIDNTHGTDLRMVRLRFYASPFGFPVRRIPPCDYCGDFVIAYLPGGSVFTLDGQAEEARVEFVGGLYQYQQPVDIPPITPQPVWDALYAAGWRGDPTDSAERLYPPAGWPQVGSSGRANHMLYGTGGQPFQWPLLSCGTMYYMTFDTPRSDAADQEGIRVSVQVVGRD